MKMEEAGFDAGVDLKGIKIALVISNNDNKTQGRVLVRVLGVHDSITIDENEDARRDWGIWANCCSTTRSGGDIPEPGDYVYVSFPDPSDPMFLLWLGFVVGTHQDSTSKKVDNSGESVMTVKNTTEETSSEGA